MPTFVSESPESFSPQIPCEMKWPEICGWFRGSPCHCFSTVRWGVRAIIMRERGVKSVYKKRGFGRRSSIWLSEVSVDAIYQPVSVVKIQTTPSPIEDD